MPTAGELLAGLVDGNGVSGVAPAGLVALVEQLRASLEHVAPGVDRREVRVRVELGADRTDPLSAGQLRALIAPGGPLDRLDAGRLAPLPRLRPSNTVRTMVAQLADWLANPHHDHLTDDQHVRLQLGAPMPFGTGITIGDVRRVVEQFAAGHGAIPMGLEPPGIPDWAELNRLRSDLARDEAMLEELRAERDQARQARDMNSARIDQLEGQLDQRDTHIAQLAEERDGLDGVQAEQSATIERLQAEQSPDRIDQALTRLVADGKLTAEGAQVFRASLDGLLTEPGDVATWRRDAGVPIEGDEPVIVSLRKTVRELLAQLEAAEAARDTLQQELDSMNEAGASGALADAEQRIELLEADNAELRGGVTAAAEMHQADVERARHLEDELIAAREQLADVTHGDLRYAILRLDAVRQYVGLIDAHGGLPTSVSVVLGRIAGLAEGTLDPADARAQAVPSELVRVGSTRPADAVGAYAEVRAKLAEAEEDRDEARAIVARWVDDPMLQQAIRFVRGVALDLEDVPHSLKQAAADLTAELTGEQLDIAEPERLLGVMHPEPCLDPMDPLHPERPHVEPVPVPVELCTCIQLKSATHLEPADWEQDPNCPVHPMTPTAVTADGEWDDVGQEAADAELVEDDDGAPYPECGLESCHVQVKPWKFGTAHWTHIEQDPATGEARGVEAGHQPYPPGHYQAGTWGADVFNPAFEAGGSFDSIAEQVAMEESLRAKAPGGKLPHELGFEGGSVWHDGRMRNCADPACRSYTDAHPPLAPPIKVAHAMPDLGEPASTFAKVLHDHLDRAVGELRAEIVRQGGDPDRFDIKLDTEPVFRDNEQIIGLTAVPVADADGIRSVALPVGLDPEAPRWLSQLDLHEAVEADVPGAADELARRNARPQVYLNRRHDPAWCDDKSTGLLLESLLGDLEPFLTHRTTSDVLGALRSRLAEPTLADGESCGRCGAPNVPAWSVMSPLWNLVMRGNDIDAPGVHGDLVCIECFIRLATEQGIGGTWRLTVDPEPAGLIFTTPTGRVWGHDAWLWRLPQLIAEPEGDPWARLLTELIRAEAAMPGHLPDESPVFLTAGRYGTPHPGRLTLGDLRTFTRHPLAAPAEPAQVPNERLGAVVTAARRVVALWNEGTDGDDTNLDEQAMIAPMSALEELLEAQPMDGWYGFTAWLQDHHEPARHQVEWARLLDVALGAPPFLRGAGRTWLLARFVEYQLDNDAELRFRIDQRHKVSSAEPRCDCVGITGQVQPRAGVDRTPGAPGYDIVAGELREFHYQLATRLGVNPPELSYVLVVASKKAPAMESAACPPATGVWLRFDPNDVRTNLIADYGNRFTDPDPVQVGGVPGDRERGAWTRPDGRLDAVKLAVGGTAPMTAATTPLSVQVILDHEPDEPPAPEFKRGGILPKPEPIWTAEQLARAGDIQAQFMVIDLDRLDHVTGALKAAFQRRVAAALKAARRG